MNGTIISLQKMVGPNKSILHLIGNSRKRTPVDEMNYNLNKIQFRFCYKNEIDEFRFLNKIFRSKLTYIPLETVVSQMRWNNQNNMILSLRQKIQKKRDLSCPDDNLFMRDFLYNEFISGTSISPYCFVGENIRILDDVQNSEYKNVALSVANHMCYPESYPLGMWETLVTRIDTVF